MILDYISFEWFKLKRQKIWLLVLIVPLVSVLLGIANFFGNYDVLMDKPEDNAWLEAWTQVTLFYGILFLPIASGIYAAIVCRTEHLNGGWKLQLSLPVPRTMVFLSKLFVVLFLILLMQFSFVLFYIIGGLITKFQEPIPWSFICTAMLLSWIGTFSLSSIQLWLSFKVKSFSIPLGINVVLSLLVFAAYTSRWGMFYPWAQPSFAISAPEESPIDSLPIFISIVMTTFVITVVLAISKFKRSDLEA